MLEVGKYLTVRESPGTLPALRFGWRDLTFLHFALEPEEIQRLLPGGLTVDTFEGKAWLGVVPFEMVDVRLYGAPPIPGTDRFPEFNVRTYVHRDGCDPGVWFFSLDAANWMAVQTAKATFGLPYKNARMSVSNVDGLLRYRSVRLDSPAAAFRADVQVGERLGPAEPGTLEFFLVERYLLYSVRFGKLLSGKVKHLPYELHKADLLSAVDSLASAARVLERPFEHVLYSPGVDVTAYAPVPV